MLNWRRWFLCGGNFSDTCTLLSPICGGNFVGGVPDAFHHFVRLFLDFLPCPLSFVTADTLFSPSHLPTVCRSALPTASPEVAHPFCRLFLTWCGQACFQLPCLCLYASPDWEEFLISLYTEPPFHAQSSRSSLFLHFRIARP